MRLGGYGERKPAQLSGGQRQRVALARAIVNRPRVLLLDEPLGALDLKLRQEMQIELKPIQHEVGITFVYVTHDQEEALTMSDRLAVFNEGRIEQVGAPAEVYEHPATEFVAGFVGVSNVLERDGRRFTCGPRRSACSTTASRADGAARRGGHDRATSSTSGMVTRYVVALDAGGELQVVRQNLETTSREALEARGRHGAVGWRRATTTLRHRRRQEEERHETAHGCGMRSTAAALALGVVAGVRRRRRERRRSSGGRGDRSRRREGHAAASRASARARARST